MTAPFTLHLGDCIGVMRTMADSSVDAIVTDPPYHLTQNARGSHTGEPKTPHARARIGDRGFMGKTWDGGDIAQRVELWAECLRVLKPGGHLLAFSGTRTQHRMVCAIEDAGFEVRDQIGWLYGSGFPKSRNIAKHDLDGENAERWAGWGTALKPAWEPICVARKPLVGTVAANVLDFGTGAINIGACLVAVEDPDYVRNCSGDRGFAESRSRRIEFGMTAGSANDNGRWPANVIHDGSEDVLEGFPQASGQKAALHGDEPSAKIGRVYEGTFDRRTASEPRHELETSAARFFYCAKASRADRNAGVGSSDAPAVTTNATMREREDAAWSTRNGNHHPTVKPTELMAYLVRLVTPPGGVVLDPFMGSGSTGKACMRERFLFVGIDVTPEYVEIARARIEHEHARVVAEAAPSPQMDLFTGEAA